VKTIKRRSKSPQRFIVTNDGDSIANRVGSLALRDLSDALGLTRALSKATAPKRQRRSRHDHGQVLHDLVVYDQRPIAMAWHWDRSLIAYHHKNIAPRYPAPVNALVYGGILASLPIAIVSIAARRAGRRR
jgi:hypothetical protein